MASYQHNGREVNTLQGRSYILPTGMGKIRWHIYNYTPDIDQSDTIRIVKAAFGVWQNVFNPIKFESTSDPNEAHILIHFTYNGNKMLPPPQPFKEGVLAYAYSLGDVWINDEWRWITGRSQGSGNGLFATLVHELGHSLNINHVEDRRALMFFEALGVDYLTDYEKNAVDFLYGEVKEMIQKDMWKGEREVMHNNTYGNYPRTNPVPATPCVYPNTCPVPAPYNPTIEDELFEAIDEIQRKGIPKVIPVLAALAFLYWLITRKVKVNLT